MKRIILLVSVISLIANYSCEKDDKNNEISEDIPIGVNSWGDEDNYIIQGLVTDQDGAIVTSIEVNVWDNGLDGIQGDYLEKNDDIELRVKTDAQGKYKFQGLPSQIGVNMSQEGLYHLNVPETEPWKENRIYEMWGRGLIPEKNQQFFTQNITLYKIVNETKIEGYVKDNEGNIVTDVNFDIRKNDFRYVGIWCWDLNNDNLNEDAYYNKSTGFYHFKNMFSGGAYAIKVDSDTSLSSGWLTVTLNPGLTTAFNITLLEQ